MMMNPKKEHWKKILTKRGVNDKDKKFDFLLIFRSSLHSSYF